MFGLLLALSLSAALTLPAYDRAPPFPMTAQPGDTWSYVEQRSIKTNEPGSRSGVTGRTATLKFVAVLRRGYVMEWTDHTLTSGGFTFGKEGPVPALGLGIPISYLAVETGFPVKVFNREAVIDQAFAAPPNGVDPAEFAQVRAGFERMDDATLALRMVEEASVIAQCQQLRLDPDKPIIRQYLKDIPLGPPVLTRSSVTLETRGSTTKPARIVITQDYDPASAKASFLAAARKAGGEAAVQKQSARPLAIRHSTTITCDVDPATGHAVRVVTDVDYALDGISKRDVRTVTLTQR